MTNEEAIKWLENLKQDIGQLRHENLWPYAQAIDEIIDMLKEQEPRVLTLNEAVDGNQCYCVEFRYHLDCGWVKCDFSKMYLNGEVSMLFLRDRTFYQQREHYGKLWRLWNKRPTYEQKMAVEWE